MRLNLFNIKKHPYLDLFKHISLLLFLFIFYSQFLFSQPPDIFTTSFQNDAIGRYSGANGAFEGYFVSPGSGGLDQPQKIFFHPNTGNMLVTGFFNNAVKEYNGETGAYIGNWSSGYNLSSPTKMILGNDNLLYVSQWDGKVVRFNLDGSFVDEFTSITIPAGLGMEWDDDDNLYVASWGSDGFNGQVYRFDPQGNSMGVFINSTQLDGPSGLWRDEAGDFFVTDWRKGSVLQFDSNGTFKGTFISGNDRIEGHAFADNGEIYICNVSVNQVKRYSANGVFINTFIDDSNLAGPNDIVFEPIATPTENPLMEFIQLKAWPNPVSEQLNIQFNLPYAELVNLKIFNTMGQEMILLKKELLMPAGINNFNLDIVDFTEGVYFIRMQLGGMEIEERIVKINR